jgi:hypothetical protein
MKNSETYQVLKTLIEQRLLVISHLELIQLLDKFRANGQIIDKEREELLKLAKHLKIYDLPITKKLP